MYIYFIFFCDSLFKDVNYFIVTSGSSLEIGHVHSQYYHYKVLIIIIITESMAQSHIMACYNRIHITNSN